MKITKNLLTRLIKESLEQMNEMAPPYAEYISGFSKATEDDFEEGEFSSGTERDIKGGGFVKGKGTILPFKDEISLTPSEKLEYAKKLVAFKNAYNAETDPAKKVNMLLYPEELSLSEDEKQKLSSIRSGYLSTSPMEPSIMSIVGGEDLRLKDSEGNLPDTFVNIGQKKKGLEARHDSIKANRFLVGDMKDQLGDKYNPRAKYKAGSTREVSDDLNLQKDKTSGLSGGRTMVRGVRSGDYGSEAQAGLEQAETSFKKTQPGEVARGVAGGIQNKNAVLRKIVDAYNNNDQQKIELLMTAAITAGIDVLQVIEAATEGKLPEGIAPGEKTDQRAFPRRSRVKSGSEIAAAKSKKRQRRNLQSGDKPKKVRKKRR